MFLHFSKAWSLQAGKSRRSSRSVAEQLLAWNGASFDQFIDQRRLALLQLLAGDVALVIPRLGAGWRPAFAARLLHAQTAPIPQVVADYSTAAAAGSAPVPLPLYAENQRCRDAGHHATDINFELLQLYARQRLGQAQLSPEALAQLLRPAGYSPEPLDHMLAWCLLTALTADGAVESNPAAAGTVRVQALMSDLMHSCSGSCSRQAQGSPPLCRLHAFT